jgi:hypothetical protein
VLVGAYRLNVRVTAENLDTFTAEAGEVARQCSSSSSGGPLRPVRRTSRWPASRPLAREEACRALDRMSVRTLEGDLPGGYGVYVEHAVYQGDRWWPPLGDRTTDEPGYGDRLVSRYADRGVSTTHRGFGGEVTMFTIAFWQASCERGYVAPLGRSSQSGVSVRSQSGVEFSIDGLRRA